MVNSIQASINDYINMIPRDAGDTILKSAVYSFVLSTLLSSNAQTGLVVGALAATVSGVHALTTPLFKKIIGSNTANLFQRVAHTVVSLALAQAVVNQYTHLKVNILAGAALSIFISFLINGTGNNSLNHNATYLFV
ncbi:MAG: hypothetical protein H0V82_01880 [Candidatus Protochlamydia sp.]|nr:hypothetical protein [Candidatus Protochlamydia sp.]